MHSPSSNDLNFSFFSRQLRVLAKSLLDLSLSWVLKLLGSQIIVAGHLSALLSGLVNASGGNLALRPALLGTRFSLEIFLISNFRETCYSFANIPNFDKGIQQKLGETRCLRNFFLSNAISLFIWCYGSG